METRDAASERLKTIGGDGFGAAAPGNGFGDTAHRLFEPPARKRQALRRNALHHSQRGKLNLPKWSGEGRSQLIFANFRLERRRPAANTRTTKKTCTCTGSELSASPPTATTGCCTSRAKRSRPSWCSAWSSSKRRAWRRRTPMVSAAGEKDARSN